MASGSARPDAARELLLDPQSGELSLRRLHSLAGVVPVGVFLIAHVAMNARGMAGEQAFERPASAVRNIPLWAAVEVIGIVLPLLFHASYGIKLALQMPPRDARDRYGSEGLYRAQRVSGALTLLFIVFHLWEFWVPKMLGRMAPDAFYGVLMAHLSSTWAAIPVWVVLYLVGMSAVSFHFANGLFAASRLFAPRASEGKERAFRLAFAGLGIAIFLSGTSTTIFFATGLRFAPFESHTSVAEPRCSVIDRADQKQAPRPGPSSP
jgi:succinate dehydrogenase/fumarate reductase cytochrome b subunit (b558 family)